VNPDQQGGGMIGYAVAVKVMIVEVMIRLARQTRWNKTSILSLFYICLRVVHFGCPLSKI